MCCTVVLLSVSSCSFIHFQGNSFACGDHTGFHMTYMSEFTAAKLDGVFYYELTVCSFDHTCISDLSTHSCVEWSLLCKDSSFLSFHQGVYDLCLCCKDCYFGIKGKMIVSYEFCCNLYIDIIIYSCVSTHIVCHFTCRTCFVSLLFHTFLEACLVNIISFFLKDLFCKIHRESVSII